MKKRDISDKKEYSLYNNISEIMIRINNDTLRKYSFS